MQVMKQFRAIAATSGNKSQDRKRGMITTMLAASKPQEAGYIMRALQVPSPALRRALYCLLCELVGCRV